MDIQIIVALIGILEAVIAALCPLILNRLSEHKSKTKAKAQLLPQYKQDTCDDSIAADIDQIFEQLMEPQKTNNNTSVYLRDYNARIEVYLENSTATVTSHYTLTFVNPYKEDYVFKRRPMLRDGLEYDTYSFFDVKHLGRDFSHRIITYPTDQQYCHSEPYRIKCGLEIPISKEYPESVLRFSSKYQIEGARFFNAYYFFHYCKHINVDVHLSGPDADKYELRWCVFLPTNRRNTSAERNVPCEEPHHVNFSADGWLCPSDGYVITVNKV